MTAATPGPTSTPAITASTITIINNVWHKHKRNDVINLNSNKSTRNRSQSQIQHLHRHRNRSYDGNRTQFAIWRKKARVVVNDGSLRIYDKYDEYVHIDLLPDSLIRIGNDAIVYHGWLLKKGKLLWNSRWCVLFKAGFLKYVDAEQKQEIRSVDFADSQIKVSVDNRNHKYVLSFNGKVSKTHGNTSSKTETFQFRCKDKYVQSLWYTKMKAIQQDLVRFRHRSVVAAVDRNDSNHKNKNHKNKNMMLNNSGITNETTIRGRNQMSSQPTLFALTVCATANEKHFFAVENCSVLEYMIKCIKHEIMKCAHTNGRSTTTTATLTKTTTTTTLSTNTTFKALPFLKEKPPPPPRPTPTPTPTVVTDHNDTANLNGNGNGNGNVIIAQNTELTITQKQNHDAQSHESLNRNASQAAITPVPWNNSVGGRQIEDNAVDVDTLSNSNTAGIRRIVKRDEECEQRRNGNGNGGSNNNSIDSANIAGIAEIVADHGDDNAGNAQVLLDAKAAQFKSYFFAIAKAPQKYYPHFVEHDFNDMELLMELDKNDMAVLMNDCRMNRLHVKHLLTKVSQLKAENTVFQEWLAALQMMKYYQRFVSQGLVTLQMIEQEFEFVDAGGVSDFVEFIGHETDAIAIYAALCDSYNATTTTTTVVARGDSNDNHNNREYYNSVANAHEGKDQQIEGNQLVDTGYLLQM